MLNTLLLEEINIEHLDDNQHRGHNIFKLLWLHNWLTNGFNQVHGHDFIILAQGDSGDFDWATLNDTLVNPARRDVAQMPGQGYLVIAFPIDNTGVWLLHCHIGMFTILFFLAIDPVLSVVLSIFLIRSVVDKATFQPGIQVKV